MSKRKRDIPPSMRPHRVTTPEGQKSRDAMKTAEPVAQSTGLVDQVLDSPKALKFLESLKDEPCVLCEKPERFGFDPP
jgi:hypothetical protein